MPRKRKTGKVIISNHALDQYHARTGRETSRRKLAKLLSILLYNQLRIGRPSKAAHVLVNMPDSKTATNVRAVMVPDVQGFWVCETFLSQNEEHFY